MSDVPALLVLTHSRAGSTARLSGAVIDGAQAAVAALAGGTSADGGCDEPLRVESLEVTEADLDDVLAAAGVVFATPARFGALAGLTKDFLERIYPWFEEVPNVRPGMPWSAVVKGASDPSGAVRDLERILTGLRWKQVLPPLEVVGDVTGDHLASAHELGATMAAGVATRTF